MVEKGTKLIVSITSHDMSIGFCGTLAFDWPFADELPLKLENVDIEIHNKFPEERVKEEENEG